MGLGSSSQSEADRVSCDFCQPIQQELGRLYSFRGGKREKNETKCAVKGRANTDMKTGITTSTTTQQSDKAQGRDGPSSLAQGSTVSRLLFRLKLTRRLGTSKHQAGVRERGS